MDHNDEADAFFTVEGDNFVPSKLAVSPWSPELLHGRLFGGLAARVVERRLGGDGYAYARLTVDLFRAAPLQPVTVDCSLARDGRRLRLAEVVLRCDGEAVARAGVLMLRRSPQPDTGEVWASPPWSVPAPGELPGPGNDRDGGGVPWELRPITGGGFFTSEQRRMWHRDTHPLVAGEPLSPFVRVGLAADLASPMSLSGTRGLHFINADFTLYLQRLPAGEWIGLEASNYLAGEGVAVGSCNLYDGQGPIGTSQVAAVATPALGSR